MNNSNVTACNAPRFMLQFEVTEVAALALPKLAYEHWLEKRAEGTGN